MTKIYVKFNSAIIKEVVLEKNDISFGRKSDNDIVIDHPTVSGHHGRFRKEEGHFVVEDLNSTNGTFINGRRIKSGKVKDRDQIGVAGHILDFYADDTVHVALTEPAAAPAPIPPQREPPVKPATAPTTDGIAKIRIISGAVDGQNEVVLKDAITYMGTKHPATVKISGFLAPDLAAAITRKPEGYFLKAIKAGYPKVNGMAVQQQVLLENGAVIEMGGSYMLFVKSH